MKTNIFGMTLMELVVSLVIMTFVILGFTSFTLFSRSQVLSSDRRLKISNEVLYVLEHMQKHIMQGIGSRDDQPVDLAISPARIRIRWYKNVLSGPFVDKYLAYYYSPPGNTYAVKFFADYPAAGWNSAGGEILSTKITALQFLWPWPDNFVQVSITGCYDPSQLSTCGSISNPNINMHTRIKMPAASTH